MCITSVGAGGLCADRSCEPRGEASPALLRGRTLPAGMPGLGRSLSCILGRIKVGADSGAEGRTMEPPKVMSARIVPITEFAESPPRTRFSKSCRCDARFSAISGRCRLRRCHRTSAFELIFPTLLYAASPTVQSLSEEEDVADHRVRFQTTEEAATELTPLVWFPSCGRCVLLRRTR
jgi:hypothetical protein